MNKQPKRFLVVLMFLVLLTACKSAKPSVDVYVYYENDTFINNLVDYLYIDNNDNYDINLYYASDSQSIQNTQITDNIENGERILLINPVDRLSAGAIAKKCDQSNVPVIFFNREPLMKDIIKYDNIYYVGADVPAQGESQAKLAAELLGDPDNLNPDYDKNGDNIVQVVILKGEQGHQDAEIRTLLCVSTLQEMGYKVDTICVETANWNRSEGYTAMKNIYASYKDDIELIFSNNDDMALGAIDYLKEIDCFTENTGEYSQPFILIGVDGTEVGIEAVKDGYMYGTVFNNDVAQADAIMLLVDYIINNKSLDDFPYELDNDRYVYVNDITIITKEDCK